MSTKFVICVNNEAFPLDLTIHKVYRVIPDERADKHGMIRLIDDTGEDYFYPTPMFLPVEVSAQVEETFVPVTA